MALARARPLRETYRLAQQAARRCGVTRLADVGGLAGCGLPLYQAIRPEARLLTVSQGKGGSPLAAKVSALLEACELASAEALPRPPLAKALATMPARVRNCWAARRGALTIDLDPALERPWVEGRVLGSGEAMPMPWDLLSLDFTQGASEITASSDGLATGNTREEAELAALAECLEHEFNAAFASLSPLQRRKLQIDARGMCDPRLRREIAKVVAAGFAPRFWSIGQHAGVAAIACKLFAARPALDDMAPTGGSACHPERATAALAALREAVQGRAALVAGSRDDLLPHHYSRGRERTLALALDTLALGEGAFAWTEVPDVPCATAGEGVEQLRKVAAHITDLPIVVFDHPPIAAGLYTVHALAPGLRNLCRQPHRTAAWEVRAPLVNSVQAHASAGRAILFAGPSIDGLTVPAEIELRPPAICGDLAALLRDPPAAVGLVDGAFGMAPSVWHKEILDLLSRGVRVIGAASLGALRAAELEAFGMEGVGAIFAAYRDGAIARDDAVMLLQAPAELGFAPLTLALVDAEYALAAAPCSARQRRMMQRIVRTTPYQLRTWDGCLATYRDRTGQRFPVSGEDLQRGSSRKREDAALLLKRLAAARHKPPPARSSPPPMNGHYLRLLARIHEDGAPARASRNRRGGGRAAARYR